VMAQVVARDEGAHRVAVGEGQHHLEDLVEPALVEDRGVDGVVGGQRRSTRDSAGVKSQSLGNHLSHIGCDHGSVRFSVVMDPSLPVSPGVCCGSGGFYHLGLGPGTISIFSGARFDIL